MLPKLILVLFSLFSLSLTQVTEGCAKYNLDQNNVLRCVQCFYTMGLTSSYTCEYCKTPKVVADGICKLPAAYLTSNNFGSGDISVNPTISQNNNLQTNQQETQQIKTQELSHLQQVQAEAQSSIIPNQIGSSSPQNISQNTKNFGNNNDLSFGEFEGQSSFVSHQSIPIDTNLNSEKEPITPSINSTLTSATSPSTIPSKQTVLPNTTQTSEQNTHKYPQFPYCADFDNDQCWACVPGYLLNLIIKKCSIYVKPPIPVLSSSSSSSSVLSSPSSTDPEENCNTYSSIESKCTECFRGYFWDNEKKICSEVNKLCNTYNPDNGECLSCYNKYNLNEGKCITV